MTADTESEPAPKKFGANISQLAQESGLSESYLRRLAKENRLPGCRRLGWRYICHRQEFENWLKAGGQG